MVVEVHVYNINGGGGGLHRIDGGVWRGGGGIDSIDGGEDIYSSNGGGGDIYSIDGGGGGKGDIHEQFSFVKYIS